MSGTISESHLKFMKNDATLTCHLGWISLTILPSTIVYKILSHMRHIWPQWVSLISFPPSLPFSNFTPTTLASLLFLESTKLVPNLRACTCSSSAWNDLTDIDTVCPLTSLRAPLRNQFLRENLPLFPQQIPDCPVILYPLALVYFPCELVLLLEGLQPSTYLVSACLRM